MREDDLTVPEAATALGTSPQTVRTLLRKGELGGRKQPWGNRYVWVPSRQGVEEFLSQHGRLDGHRRRGPSRVAAPTEVPVAPPGTAEPEPDPELERPVRRPFVLRPRGRATVVVVLLGAPLLVAYIAARVLPGALWFDELGQSDVLRRVVLAKIELTVLVAGTVAVFTGVNLRIALRRTEIIRRRSGTLGLVVASVIVGTFFSSAVADHWQTFLLWTHRQPFGIDDQVHGRDVGYFVFSLPFELLLSTIALWLVAIAALLVAIVYEARGWIGLRPLHATYGARVHFAILTAAILLVVAWRLRLEEYRLELGQPSPGEPESFAGAGYVDVHVRMPELEAMAVLAVVLAVLVLAAPFLARTTSGLPAGRLVGIPVLVLLIVGSLGGVLVPTLVQRFAVDPNPVLSEGPYLERSIAATRTGLGLDSIDVEPYAPSGSFSAADYAAARKQLGNVLIWDAALLEARMRQLVTDTPYYSPQESSLDPVRIDGRVRLTVVSARELDLDPVGHEATSWASHRLSFTHGLGLVRFSGTEVSDNRQPLLVDSRVPVREPRIYFGNHPQDPMTTPTDEEQDEEQGGEEPEEGEDAPAAGAPTPERRLEDSPWVLVNTRRPEVDLPGSEGTPRVSYHYDGPAGIDLSSRIRRAAFALALGSKELFLSDDITPDSRILLHRDVHDRLQTLAPFIQWDSHAVPLTSDGRVVFVVDGYTTSDSYPYAEQVNLGGILTNYVRASVRATVDAFTGEVDLYLTDPDEPIARAWAEVFPTLFRPADEFPADLADRLRYPADLFDAQATAYETYHASRPDLFVSQAEAWARPIALAGPIEVAGNVDFDESDEDDLRLTMEPGYTFSAPPGESAPRLVRGTYYTPRSGQNLVATLSGWIDDGGQLRLSSRSLSRDEVVLGPAQVSRLVFATPRVSNLLGLRNLEVRDLQRSSLDAVLLGRPHLLFLPAGLVQIQSLFEGSRGPGAARLIGVTAYLNGRAGFGPDIESAVRQALNESPFVKVVPPPGPIAVGKRLRVEFDVENAKRETVTITTGNGSRRRVFKIASGTGTVAWVPRTAGEVRVRVDVDGLDGTTASDRTTFTVLSAPPTVEVGKAPRRVVVGEPVRIPFSVTNALEARATVSTASGIAFDRRYLLRDGAAVVEWTPETAGRVVVHITALGREGQVASRKLRFKVGQSAPPTVQVGNAPRGVVVGEPVLIPFSVTNALSARATVSTTSGVAFDRRYLLRNGAAVVEWTPETEGAVVLYIVARGREGQVTTRKLRFEVAPSAAPPTPPTVTLVRVPDRLTVGVASEFAFSADGCRTAVARIEGPGGEVRSWRFPCPARSARFTWTPTVPGRHLFTVTARGSGVSSQRAVTLRVVDSP